MARSKIRKKKPLSSPLPRNVAKPLPAAAECRVSVPPKWERIAVAVIVLFAFLLQANGALHKGSVGQDWGPNSEPAIAAAKGDLSSVFSLGLTNPAFFYGFNALIYRATGGAYFAQAAGLWNSALSAASLLLFAVLLRAIVRNPVLRVTALLALALLPTRVVHTTVVAADTWTIPGALLLIWLLWRLSCSNDRSRRYRYAFAFAVVFSIALYLKFTFLSLFPAAAVALIQIARARRFTTGHTAALTAAMLLLPVAAFAAEWQAYTALRGIARYQQHFTGAISLRSMLFPKAVDARLLRAPSYWTPIETPGRPDENTELLVDDRYSYPALLHVALWTDLKDIFQPKADINKNWFGKRTEFVRRAMSLAVKTALPATVFAVFSVLFLTAVWLGKAIRKAAAMPMLAQILLLFGGAWFLALYTSFPYIPLVYKHGYWLPRLILPSVACAAALTFYLLDRWIGTRAVACYAVLAYVVAQSALSVSFLWMTQ